MIQIVWLLFAALLVFLAWLARDWMPYLVGGVCAASLILWIVVSSLWPSKPDRHCPRCARQGLVKIRRGEPGVRCEYCDFRDDSMHVAYLDDW